MTTVRLTAAQALVRWLQAQMIDGPDGAQPYFAGVWAIFGHGNVAALGEALYAARSSLPTWRAHNEQTMAHAAIAFAKQARRRRAMVCTTSIGPGALNMVTAAAVAHVNRLPVLLLPGDVFAGRGPDPDLQQIVDFADGTVSANDCFRPVSRYFDRITRPEQLLVALPRAMSTLIDPAGCGPVTLALCQDVQAQAFDWAAAFFHRHLWRIRRPAPDPSEIGALCDAILASKQPLIIAGGGVLYSQAENELARLARATGIPVAETQAGKGTLPWDHPQAVGAIGVTGTSAANELAREADLIIGIGTRLQDFTTGSRQLINTSGSARVLFQVNVEPYDAGKHDAVSVVGDARAIIAALAARLPQKQFANRHRDLAAAWLRQSDSAMAAPTDAPRPSDAQVIGAVLRNSTADTVIVCAAGGLPGELHRHWRTQRPGGYHGWYVFSCMCCEIAGGIGVKLADPDRDVIVMVGDGSYLMANSEIATAAAAQLDLTIVVLNNSGFGCINRLQQACGSAPFNNLLTDCGYAAPPVVDFVSHASSLGARARQARGVADLEHALANRVGGVECIVIETDPTIATTAGGAWWDVAVPEVSQREEVVAASAEYARHLAARMGGQK